MHRNVNSNCLHCLLYGAHNRVAFVIEKFNPNSVAGFHELHFGTCGMRKCRIAEGDQALNYRSNESILNAISIREACVV